MWRKLIPASFLGLSVVLLLSGSVLFARERASQRDAAGLTVSYLLQGAGNQVLAKLAASGALEGFLSVDLSTSSSTSLISIPNDLAMFAVGLATCIGVSAGLYLAMRAAHMTTVLALKTD